tara:strand:- start:788 stop:1141 length:354 start_codon:yes stop_codon:yes gene_type:complete
MPVTANLSSTFSITCTATGGGASTVTMPGRAFKIVAITANNTTGGALTLDVLAGGQQVSRGGAVSIAANACELVELVSADLEVAVTETLSINPNGAGLDPICIYCVATLGGAPLVVT